MSLAGLPVDVVAQRCAEETEKFAIHRVSDPQFCFELLRRALADGLADAVTHMYHIYEPQVRSWVHRHPGFASAHESPDHFVSAALSTFYFALRGPKFDRFGSLGQVLTYLKMCVHTAILQHLRDQQGRATVPLDAAETLTTVPALELDPSTSEVWTHICHLLPDQREQLLARCAFFDDLKPRQISALYPAVCKTERDVSVALYRVRRRLRDDADLRRWLGNDDGSK